MKTTETIGRQSYVTSDNSIAVKAARACRNPGRYIHAAIGVFLTVADLPVAHAMDRREYLHLATNLRGGYAGPASLGFNLADVSTEEALNALPQGVRAVYWLGNGYNLSCSWRVSDQGVTRIVRALKGHPKFSGI